MLEAFCLASLYFDKRKKRNIHLGFSFFLNNSEHEQKKKFYTIVFKKNIINSVSIKSTMDRPIHDWVLCCWWTRISLVMMMLKMNLLKFLLFQLKTTLMLKIMDETHLRRHKQLLTLVTMIHCSLPWLQQQRQLQRLEHDIRWRLARFSWEFHRETSPYLCPLKNRFVCLSVFDYASEYFLSSM